MIMTVAAFLLALALVLSVVSLAKEQAIPNKLVSLEVIVNLLIAGIALMSLVREQPLMLDICLAVALVMFLSNLAYCQYLSRMYRD